MTSMPIWRNTTIFLCLKKSCGDIVCNPVGYKKIFQKNLAFYIV